MKIRGILVLVVVAGVTAALFPSAAYAGSLTTDNPLGPYKSASGGGEFSVVAFSEVISKPAGDMLSGLNPDVLFQTFCVERNENVGAGKTYYTELSEEAKKGGYNGGSPDPLDLRTSYLFYHFWKADTTVLHDYDFTGGAALRSLDAAQLQNAIWFIEGEITTLNPTTQGGEYFTKADNAVNSGAWDWHHGVKVINMWTDSTKTNFIQDWLVVVPLPGSALMGFGLLFGLGAMHLIRRKRQVL